MTRADDFGASKEPPDDEATPDPRDEIFLSSHAAHKARRFKVTDSEILSALNSGRREKRAQGYRVIGDRGVVLLLHMDGSVESLQRQRRLRIVE